MITKDKCMKKLTKEEILKFPNTCYGQMLGKQLSNQVVGELLQYKQLEEQLGCPFYVIKHLINGLDFFYEDEYGIHLISSYNIENNTINFDDDWQDHDIEVGDFGGIELVFTEYKKSFWLREDKSE